MEFNTLVLLILVAAGAFYAGFQVGRFKTLSERAPSTRTASDADDDQTPLDGPIVHSRPRGAPPPAGAGDEGGAWTGSGSSSGAGPVAGGNAPPRRSTKPPPAAAGLLDKGTGKARKEPN